MATKQFCDWCGVEIVSVKKGRRVKIKAWDLHRIQAEKETDKELELCLDCYHAFTDGINKTKNERMK